MRRGEQIFIILIILFSVIILVNSTKLPLKAEYTIGPGFLPMIVSILMILISIAILFQNYQKRESLKQKPMFDERNDFTRLMLFFALLLISILLMNYLGIIIPLILFMIITFRFIEKYSWVTTLKVSIVSNIIFYLIFKVWLGVPLPIF